MEAPEFHSGEHGLPGHAIAAGLVKGLALVELLRFTPKSEEEELLWGCRVSKRHIHQGLKPMDSTDNPPAGLKTRFPGVYSGASSFYIYRIARGCDRQSRTAGRMPIARQFTAGDA